MTENPTGLKKGRISNDEKNFISQNLNLSVEEIAAHLKRDPVSIEDFIKREFRVGTNEEEAAAYDLQERPYWKEIQKQFDEDEQAMFKFHWSRIISQFRADVIPTEELQIVDLIKLELLMSRCLTQNKYNMELIAEREIEIARLREGGVIDEAAQAQVFNLERLIANLKAAQESLNKDYRELQSKKSIMMKDMKATREQRVQRLEDSKHSFRSWVAHLFTNPSIARAYGVEAEKMRLAMMKERDRLSEFHTYNDGTVDQPFLTPETVKD